MMLKMLDIFGKREVTGNLTYLSECLDVKRSYLVTHLRELKDLDWIDTDREYLKTDGNLPKVAGVKIYIKV